MAPTPTYTYLLVNELHQVTVVLVLGQMRPTLVEQVEDEISGEAFVEPQLRPVAHRHQVAEPSAERNSVELNKTLKVGGGGRTK